MNLNIIEKSLVQNKRFLSTIVSYSAVLTILINLSIFQSPLIGVLASTIFFVINAVLLGNAFFKEENTFFRLSSGVLSLIMLLGVVGWLVMIIYNLDVVRFTIVLFVVTTISSMANRRMKHRNVSQSGF